nr:uncharacterized protein LOC111992133 isoform X2 [Quercus suber]XP_023879728.1 uncharacterized protein LOC111992133 isoform X2 [Quercus suber]XP_023879729.1 uncharacterized protein LOC111992133 isoform X2 [Quercus suber]
MSSGYNILTRGTPKSANSSSYLQSFEQNPIHTRNIILIGDPSAEEFVDPTTAVDPPPSSSSDSSIRSMLNTVITVQAAHGQILLDVLTELQALRDNLASARCFSPPPPFDDES